MAEDQDEQSPWTRGGFIGAAVVVAVVVVLGIVLAVTAVTGRDDAQATPAPTPGASASEGVAAPAPSSPPPDDDGSVCGLDGEQLDGTLATAPDAEWQYQGTTAYPTSSTYGPGRTSEEGVRSCFQRSPAGALLMAANSLTQGSDPATAPGWVQYAIADGDNRAQLVNDIVAPSGATDSRIELLGFRLLAYDGDTARIDLAARTAADGATVTVSGVYELVWQSGDWKINSDVAEPLNVAMIPDLAGYISWRA